MKKLSFEQKEFIKKCFFGNSQIGDSVADKLLDSGECIVCTMYGDIWTGGISNFIKIDTVENGVDCVKYTLDFDTFLDTAWYKEVRENYLKELEETRATVELIINSINNI